MHSVKYGDRVRLFGDLGPEIASGATGVCIATNEQAFTLSFDGGLRILVLRWEDVRKREKPS